MSAAPVVSVIIPAFNAGNYVRDTLKSVLAQSLSQFEIIVIDDGSTDGTADCVTSFDDCRVQYFWQKNLSQAVARNNGIGRSKGEFVAFLDADDQWHPKKLEKQTELFKNKHVGVTYTGAQYMDKAGNLKGRVSTVFEKGFVLQKLSKVNFISCSSVMVRKSILTNNNLQFRLGRQGAEDYDLWLQLASLTEFDYINGCLLFYRNHQQSISHDWDLMHRSQMVTFDDFIQAISRSSSSKKERRTLITNCQKYRSSRLLQYGHWLLQQDRKNEAKEVIKEAIRANKYNIRNYWGWIKMYCMTNFTRAE